MVATGVDDVEEWLVVGPLSLEATDVKDLRGRLSREMVDLAAGGRVVSGARAAAEGLTGTVLALALSLFLVKDGPLLRVCERRSANRERFARPVSPSWVAVEEVRLGPESLGLVSDDPDGGASMIEQHWRADHLRVERGSVRPPTSRRRRHEHVDGPTKDV